MQLTDNTRCMQIFPGRTSGCASGAAVDASRRLAVLLSFRVLSFNLGLTSIVILIVLTALIASGKSITLLNTLPTFLYQFLIQFAVITVIFGFADRHWTKFPDRWDPRGLKHAWHPVFGMQATPEEERISARDNNRVSRFDSIAQFVALGVTIGWLRVAQHSPFMILGPAAAFIKPAPIWHQLYWPIVALALAGMAQAGINLLRPDCAIAHGISTA